VAGLLTLAQGAFAFFSAQNYAKQADDAVRKIKELGAAASADFGKQAGAAVKKIEALGADASARFPMLAGTERANERAFRRLAKILSSSISIKTCTKTSMKASPSRGSWVLTAARRGASAISNC